MKKILFFLVMSCCILPISYASSSLGSSINLSSSEFQTYIDKGYISSDKFTSFNECSSQKDRYNLEYPSYKRSDCFVSDNTYKYFICGINESCSIVKTTTSVGNQQIETPTTSPTQTNNIPNKDKLDNFISKVSSMRETMTPAKFKSTLDSVVSKLNSLEKKYSSNATIKSMIVYLNDGVKGLYEQSDIDDFFCDLTGTCKEVGLNNNTNTSTNNTNTSTSTNTKIDGSCGDAQGKTFSSTPQSGLCKSGKASLVRMDGTSALVWSCEGNNGGETKSCFAYNGNGYINLVNGNGLQACNQQIIDKLGRNSGYICSIGGGCSLNGQPKTSANPSANPQHAGACIQLSVWNNTNTSTNNTNNTNNTTTNTNTSTNNTNTSTKSTNIEVDKTTAKPGESIFYSYNVTSEFNYCIFEFSNGSGGGSQTFTVGKGKTGGETMSMKGSGYVQLNCTKSGFSVKKDGTDDFSKKINIIVPDKYKCKAETKDGYTFTSEVFNTKKTFRSTQDIRGGTLTYQALFECLSDGTWKLVQHYSTPTINCNDGYIKEGNGCIEFKNPSTKKTYDVAKNAKYICKTYQGDVTFKYSYGSDPTTDELFFGTSSTPFGSNIRMSLYVGKGSSLNGNLPSTIHSKIGNTYDCNNSNKKVGVTSEECQDTYVCKLEGSSTSTSGGTTTTSSSSTSTPTTTIKATASGAPLICNDTSVSSSWFKEKGRCGEQGGIDYWNRKIKELGEIEAKRHFNYNYDENIKKNSNGLDGILCPTGYKYVKNTEYCAKK